MDVLQQLRAANKKRCPMFGQGSIYDWSEERWALAMAGEVGEMCNLVKKSIRDGNIDRKDIAKEVADVVIYADMMAQKLGFSLAEILVQKFNEVSDRLGKEAEAPKISRQYPEFDHESGRVHHIRYATQIEGKWYAVKVLKEGGYINPKSCDFNEAVGPFESGPDCTEFVDRYHKFFKNNFGWSDNEIADVIHTSFKNNPKDYADGN